MARWIFWACKAHAMGIKCIMRLKIENLERDAYSTPQKKRVLSLSDGTRGMMRYLDEKMVIEVFYLY